MTDPVYIDKPHYIITDKTGVPVKRLPPETTIGDALQAFVERGRTFGDVRLGFQFRRHTTFSAITISEARFLFIKRQEMLDRKINT